MLSDESALASTVKSVSVLEDICSWHVQVAPESVEIYQSNADLLPPTVQVAVWVPICTNECKVPSLVLTMWRIVEGWVARVVAEYATTLGSMLAVEAGAVEAVVVTE